MRKNIFLRRKTLLDRYNTINLEEQDCVEHINVSNFAPHLSRCLLIPPKMRSDLDKRVIVRSLGYFNYIKHVRNIDPITCLDSDKQATEHIYLIRVEKNQELSEKDLSKNVFFLIKGEANHLQSVDISTRNKEISVLRWLDTQYNMGNEVMGLREISHILEDLGQKNNYFDYVHRYKQLLKKSNVEYTDEGINSFLKSKIDLKKDFAPFDSLFLNKHVTNTYSYALARNLRLCQQREAYIHKLYPRGPQLQGRRARESGEGYL